MIEPMVPRTDAWRGLALAAALATMAGCATTGAARRPEGGRITVGVTSTGAAQRQTFRVSIEPAGISGSISADAGVFTSGAVPPGTHVVRLTGLPATCRVSGEGAERQVTVTAERGGVVRFDVVCR